MPLIPSDLLEEENIDAFSISTQDIHEGSIEDPMNWEINSSVPGNIAGSESDLTSEGI
mgnify:CR=1 FL=1